MMIVEHQETKDLYEVSGHKIQNLTKGISIDNETQMARRLYSFTALAFGAIKEFEENPKVARSKDSMESLITCLNTKRFAIAKSPTADAMRQKYRELSMSKEERKSERKKEAKKAKRNNK